MIQLLHLAGEPAHGFLQIVDLLIELIDLRVLVLLMCQAGRFLFVAFTK